jgi:hypothetical protein
LASISASSERVYTVAKWLGLNENPDGDTQLKPGEAAEMRNFRITRDGNLQKRPGMKTLHAARAWAGPIRGIWHGRVGGTDCTVFAAGGGLWLYDLAANTAVSVKKPDTVFTDAPTTFFGFSQKLYILNGHEYLEWDGSLPPSGGAVPVTGYVPLVAVSTSPTGGGTPRDQVNKLTAKRRIWFSPTGSAAAFQLPEKGLAAIGYVKNLTTGANFTAGTDYSVNLNNGTVTFAASPAAGTNTLEVEYMASVSLRSQVEAMRFAEIYNGATDNRVFLYGDGTNKAFYSGLDNNGSERADYFPDLNVLNVGSANTPITALIRHFSQMAAFKTDSAYTVDYGSITLANGQAAAAFYIVPVNRTIGNTAYGQAQLVGNNPRTLFNSAVYDWRNAYGAGLTADERQAELVSERVFASLRAMDLATAYTFDDNERQEYYVIQNGRAVVNNYATNTWYVYTDFNIALLFTAGGGLYGCTPGGDIVGISRDYKNDNGAAIDAYWRSGSLSFDRPWMTKYATKIFVTMKPENKANVQVTVKTNKKDDYAVKTVAYGFISFVRVNFAHWSFGMNTQPQTARLPVKAKGFSSCQLVFESRAGWNTATILSTEIKVKYIGEIK